MSPVLRNPFQVLYATEGITKADFPEIFSPVLLPLVRPLFQTGNVILRGTQGTGKSMLLALLDTDVRLAFWRHGTHAYPLEPEFCRFIGAGINLSNSLVLKFTERDFGGDSISRSQAVFSDYLNTWVLRDLLGALQRFIHDAPPTRLHECGISASDTNLNRAVKILARSEICGGLLGSARTVSEAIVALTKRQRTYLDFINFRIDEIPSDIWSTITGIGEPLSFAAEVLRAENVLSQDTEVFVTIDQCEELLRLDQSDSTDRQYAGFLTMLDKLISAREKAVSYRLGIRPNAVWKGKSEEVRDYSSVDLDALLSGKEYVKTMFPRLARDVFKRRLARVGIHDELPADKILKAYFGASPNMEERAKKSYAKNQPKRVIKIEESWPRHIGPILIGLANESILSAKLGEAWVRQNIEKLTPEELNFSPKELPWESDAKRWWRKERRPIAVLQIAASSGERMRHYGYKDILSLSGRNILIFALICQKIWESWVSSLDHGSQKGSQIPQPFPEARQGVGIQVASKIWHSKISASPSGDTLARFIDVLGNRLRIQLRGDKRMSYPGANGISLSNGDLSSDSEIEALLNDGVAEGFLQMFPHTPKTASRGKSKKWYLHPILSPYFQITVPHTKEPIYLKISDLRKWLEGKYVVASLSASKTRGIKKRNQSQLDLFDEGQFN